MPSPPLLYALLDNLCSAYRRAQPLSLGDGNFATLYRIDAPYSEGHPRQAQSAIHPINATAIAFEMGPLLMAQAQRRPVLAIRPLQATER